MQLGISTYISREGDSLSTLTAKSVVPTDFVQSEIQQLGFKAIGTPQT